MEKTIIIIGAVGAALLCIGGGIVKNDTIILSIGTGIIGTLLGSIGIAPATLQKVLVKLGIKKASH